MSHPRASGVREGTTTGAAAALWRRRAGWVGAVMCWWWLVTWACAGEGDCSSRHDGGTFNDDEDCQGSKCTQEHVRAWAMQYAYFLSCLEANLHSFADFFCRPGVWQQQLPKVRAVLPPQGCPSSPTRYSPYLALTPWRRTTAVTSPWSSSSTTSPAPGLEDADFEMYLNHEYTTHTKNDYVRLSTCTAKKLKPKAC